MRSFISIEFGTTIVSLSGVAIAIERQRMLTTWPAGRRSCTQSPMRSVFSICSEIARPQVRQRLACRERECAGDDRRRRDDAGEVQAHGVQPVDPVGDQAKHEEHVDEDVRNAEAAEHDVRDEQDDDRMTATASSASSVSRATS